MPIATGSHSTTVSASVQRKGIIVELSAGNHHQLWIPVAFAHGFLVLSDSADFLCKTADYCAPEHERSVAGNDPAIGIDWPAKVASVLSAKDKAGVPFQEAEVFP
jgi:dTDP-4-dehydrorhamnose 3,5-epimerase